MSAAAFLDRRRLAGAVRHILTVSCFPPARTPAVQEVIA
jgi:hypothetical protein